MKDNTTGMVSTRTVAIISLVLGLGVITTWAHAVTEVTTLRAPGVVETRSGRIMCARAQVDAAGNLVVTGYFSGTIDLGNGPVTSAGGRRHLHRQV
jgi:hypothetical protein